MGGGAPLFQLTDLKYHTIIKGNFNKCAFKAAAAFSSKGEWKEAGLFCTYFGSAILIKKNTVSLPTTGWER
ncbi:hypothetical protein [Faecalispora anaeroviscerum]|uniref:hypothetical protein n=1 Tax=Faecalispora anaeroviscerum TaxID=2991836 RepID=UPI0024B8B458|nr:hypothetical protein [Faecalispora anaeroviscerum]